MIGVAVFFAAGGKQNGSDEDCDDDGDDDVRGSDVHGASSSESEYQTGRPPAEMSLTSQPGIPSHAFPVGDSESRVKIMTLPAGDRELIQIMDAAWADAARRSGTHLACRPGCTQCCHGAFAINALDAARLRAGMGELRISHPERADTVGRRAEAWIAEFAARFPGDRATGRLGDSEGEREAFEQFAHEAACPALDPDSGRCDLYAWRPMTCRVFGPPIRMEDDVLGCCELCFTTASDEEIAVCELAVPHDEEASVLDSLENGGQTGDTVVAYALLESQPKVAG